MTPLVAIVVLLMAPGCSRDTRDAAAQAPAAEAEAELAAADGAPRIVFLGDSLTAGFGLSPEQAFPALLQERLRENGYPHDVINAGVSGDTSAGGLRRLDWSLRGNVAVLVVALGGNDGLRGLPPDELRRNLEAIIERARAQGVEVLLAGMEAPPNLGPAYTRQFRAVYAELGKAHDVRVIPFVLEGVAGSAALNQSDGIHPNAQGQRVIADLLWRQLEPMLTRRHTE